MSEIKRLEKIADELQDFVLEARKDSILENHQIYKLEYRFQKPLDKFIEDVKNSR